VLIPRRAVSGNSVRKAFSPRGTYRAQKAQGDDARRKSKKTVREARAVLEAALAYARTGLRIVPMHVQTRSGCSCRHACKTPGQHPISGPIGKRYDGVYTSQELVTAWWEQHPYASIGIMTGSRSHILALCVDRQDGGVNSLRHLQEWYEPFFPTVKIERSDGRSFLLFYHPRRPTPRENIIGQGLSLYGDGNCILMWPRCRIAEFPTGKEIRPQREGRIILLPPPPYWLLRI
jgi:Bifunctional DNA primase/polymerase, N-terminal